ncbi:MAG: regulatory iron-sulfur-containing complex subunit RicT, partial [Sediminibacterium sp.]|nr:regulatory iron-sulfur-containing complex subunit RicT [Sediminibacterium sp.]
MGCDSCGTGKPNGCKSNGGCSTGGCNRLNVSDWLCNLPISDLDATCKIVEISFKNGSRKDFYRNQLLTSFSKGDYVTVEGMNGFDVGEVSMSGEMVRLRLKKKKLNEFSEDIKKILRPSTELDIQHFNDNKNKEKEVLARSRAIAIKHHLEMKISEVEIQADGKKATFYYSAEGRVDFRELIRIYAAEFKLKIEMRQIGLRQEAAKIGGIGSCGRELCCSSWLQDFKNVNTNIARYQNLSINISKLSGQCGRLKCCLNYELDTYLEALNYFPAHAEKIDSLNGKARLVKKDIFKNLLYYTLPNSNISIPFSVEQVKYILEENKKGNLMDLIAFKENEQKPDRQLDFVDGGGQI